MRARTTGSLLLGLVLGAVLASAQAPLAPLPSWDPGLYWRYLNAERAEMLEYWVLGVRPIRGLNHYVLAQRNQRGDDTAVSLAFAPVRAPFPRRTNTPASQTYLDFPLEVGVAWPVREASSASFLSAEAISARVEAVEPVQTGFGTYDSFRVAYQREDDAWSLWYAPAAKSWVVQTSPADGSAFVLQETWQFTQAYALDALFDALDAQLAADPFSARRVLNDLIRFDFDAARAEALKTPPS